MTTLNAIVAKQLIDFRKEVEAMIEKGLKKDEAIFNVLREYIKQTKHILFEGDGYSMEWEEEAARRGLSNHKNTPAALKAKVSQKSLDLFAEVGVMNNTEVTARYEIELEDYIKKVQIEGRVLGDIVRNHIMPTAFKYQNLLIENIKGLKEIFGNQYEEYAAEQLMVLKKISMHVNELNAKLHEMMDARKDANAIDSVEKTAQAYCEKVKPYYDEIRYHADKLELMVDNELWPLTKYRELLFTR